MGKMREDVRMKAKALSRWTKAGRRMTRKELEDVKRAYHVGDEKYGPTLCVEWMVSEIEALWRERRAKKA